MKEKFAKLFGALLLVALMLGLVMPFQTAAAQEQIPLTVAPTITATKGLAGNLVVTVGIDTASTSVPTPPNLYFTLARSETESGAKILLANPVTGLTAAPTYTATYNDLTAIAGKVYWYWTQACDVTSCSAYYSASGWKEVAPVTAAPSVTTAVTGFYDKVVVGITAPGAGLPAVDGYYQVYRRVATTGTWAKLGTTTTTTYNDTTASGQLMSGPAAGQYEYKVDACGKDKCALDNLPTAPTLVVSPIGQRKSPATPVTFTTLSGDKKVTLSWVGVVVDPLVVNKYYGSRSFGAVTVPNPPKSVDALTTPEVATNVYSVDDPTVTAGVTYTYNMWVCVTPGSENCSVVATKAGSAKPAAVSDLKASDGGYMIVGNPDLQTQSILVTWTGSADPTIAAYRLYRSDDAAGLVNLSITDITTGIAAGAPMQFIDYTSDWGKTYYYWIKGCTAAFATCGSSSAVDSGWGAIPMVSNFKTTNAKTGVSGTWDAITGSGIFYKGWRSTTATFAGAAGPATILGLSGTDTTGTAGLNYFYFIQACISADRCGLPTAATPGMKLLP